MAYVNNNMNNNSSYYSSLPGGPLAKPKIELRISCRELPNLDVKSLSDPQVFGYVEDPVSNKWIEIGKTEMISDNLNPDFSTPLTIEYHFERIQKLRFLVVDIDKPNGKLDDQDMIGTFVVNLSEILSASGQMVAGNLESPKHGKKAGKIRVVAEEVNDLKQEVILKVIGSNLDKKDFFGKSDPFLKISKLRSDGRFVLIHKTEVIKNTLNPDWKSFSLPLHTLCNGDRNKRLLIECFDWNPSGKEDFIGATETTLGAIESAVNRKVELELINQSRQKKRNYKNSGVLRFLNCEVKEVPSFLDYIAGGCEINLIIGIDFTASNGDPKLPSSLHYNNPYTSNEYMKAISSIGEVLSDYDDDKKYPVYGFGGIPHRSRQTSFCFALNGNEEDPYIHTIPNVIEEYKEALNHIKLSGPTNFAPILHKVTSLTPHSSQSSQRYNILLMITDGEISDLNNTIYRIIDASEYPLSIVIVGVGAADFTKMEFLDSDDKLLQLDAKKAKRDIVQFVPFRDYKNAHPSQIAAVTLEEIPNQMTSYFKSRNILPNPKRAAPAFAGFAAIALRSDLSFPPSSNNLNNNINNNNNDYQQSALFPQSSSIPSQQQPLYPSPQQPPQQQPLYPSQSPQPYPSSQYPSQQPPSVYPIYPVDPRQLPPSSNQFPPQPYPSSQYPSQLPPQQPFYPPQPYSPYPPVYAYPFYPSNTQFPPQPFPQYPQPYPPNSQYPSQQYPQQPLQQQPQLNVQADQQQQQPPNAQYQPQQPTPANQPPSQPDPNQPSSSPSPNQFPPQPNANLQYQPQPLPQPILQYPQQYPQQFPQQPPQQPPNVQYQPQADQQSNVQYQPQQPLQQQPQLNVQADQQPQPQPNVQSQPNPSSNPSLNPSQPVVDVNLPTPSS